MKQNHAVNEQPDAAAASRHRQPAASRQPASSALESAPEAAEADLTPAFSDAVFQEVKQYFVHEQNMHIANVAMPASLHAHHQYLE